MMQGIRREGIWISCEKVCSSVLFVAYGVIITPLRSLGCHAHVLQDNMLYKRNIFHEENLSIFNIIYSPFDVHYWKNYTHFISAVSIIKINYLSLRLFIQPKIMDLFHCENNMLYSTSCEPITKVQCTMWVKRQIVSDKICVQLCG